MLAAVWFGTHPLVRLAILTVVASLILHAATGLFITDPNTVDTLVVVIHVLSVVGCVFSAVLVLRQKIFSDAANVMFALWMFLLVLVGVIDLASVLDSVVNGYPLGSLEPAGDLFRLFDPLRAWLFEAIELLVGILQIATGIVLTRMRPSPLAANLSL